jgi:TetR/AcrR family transcriptional regulator, transcriptional repressor for nem operon
MARGGVAATSLDAVRAATATSKSQLYHYFTDKADLVRAVVRHQADAVVAAQQLLQEPPSTQAALARWRYRVVAAQRARGFEAGCPLGSLAAELAGSADAATRAELAAAFTQWQGLLEEALRRGVAEGNLPVATEPREQAQALVAAVQGASVLSAVAGGPGPLQAALDAAPGVLLRN